MKRFGTASRIAFAMAMWTATVLLALRLTGVLDDGIERQIRHRTELAESIAVSCSQFASQDNRPAIDVTLQTLVLRSGDVVSAACVFYDGSRCEAGPDHADRWGEAVNQPTSSTRVSVPVLRGDIRFAEIQLCFENGLGESAAGLLSLPSIQVVTLATLANLLGFLVLLRRCFRQLDPSRAVPDRVRVALDTLAEGVLVLDVNERINLVNQSFTKLVGRGLDELAGKRIDELPWQWQADQRINCWSDLLSSVATNPSPITQSVGLLSGESAFTLQPNATPIFDHEQKCQGYLVSLNDITSLEATNRQLELLATRDPLTGCFNRRAFFDKMTALIHASNASEQTISVLMVDVDHFKSVNDTFGHATGDEVLKSVAATLLRLARAGDLVCRFGGEEFCVLLPTTDLSAAKTIGETIRNAIADLEFEKLSVTASVGCAERSEPAMTFDQMQEHADQCLYFAKRHGRNRTIGFDEVLASRSESESTKSITDESTSEPALAPEKALLRSLQQLMTDARQAGTSSVEVDQLAEAIGRRL